MTCTWHLCDRELSGRQTKFCSKNCNLKASVTRKRRSLKAQLVSEAGGQCIDCGYEGPPFMFDFDHRDPTLKSFGLSDDGHTKGINNLREEARKCDLVCANCHRMRTHVQRCVGCQHCSNQV